MGCHANKIQMHPPGVGGCILEGGVHSQLLIAVQEGHSLYTGAAGERRKEDSTCALCDAVLDSPGNGRAVVSQRAHVAEARAAEHGILRIGIELLIIAIKEGDDLRAGAGLRNPDLPSSL